MSLFGVNQPSPNVSLHTRREPQYGDLRAQPCCLIKLPVDVEEAVLGPAPREAVVDGGVQSLVPVPRLPPNLSALNIALCIVCVILISLSVVLRKNVSFFIMLGGSSHGNRPKKNPNADLDAGFELGTVF